eukprot:4517697-Pyramimonas_sp.AAC.2
MWGGYGGRKGFVARVPACNVIGPSRYILTMYQSNARSAGTFPRRANQDQRLGSPVIIRFVGFLLFVAYICRVH